MFDPENFEGLIEGYSVNDLHNDIDALVRLGLIEVKGITENGDWLYGVTEQSLRMSTDEIAALIHKQIHDED